MKYLLDTNTCIRYINGRAQNIRLKVLEVGTRIIAVSSITKAEMYAGAAKSQTPVESLAKQHDFLNRFICFDFTTETAEVFGPVRATLEKLGTPIGAYDLMIAAIALEHDLILVTHNVREFSRIEDLRIEDWE